ncbi:MAG: carboxyl transferase domain-containing protein, partial [Halieaceae bacterium]
DTTGFLPGREQEHRGIVQAGRAMLDAIVDLRTPRFLILIRNAFGGAYASYNNYPTGADFVVALPTTRVAVMGPAGVEYVYKDELKAIRSSVSERVAATKAELVSQGVSADDAQGQAEASVAEWAKAAETDLAKRYEREIMNPEEALSLGSVSQIVMPQDLRGVIAKHLMFCLRHYTPEPMSGVQREFH